MDNTIIFFYYFLACDCNFQGSLNNSCDATGLCNCGSLFNIEHNIVGDKCDQCDAGYFGFPNCQGNYF